MESTLPLPRYIVLTAAAQMPSSNKFGVYRRVAVIELDGSGVQPKMISERARGVTRIVETWERLSVGTTERCAYRVALAKAEALAARLNEYLVNEGGQ